MKVKEGIVRLWDCTCPNFADILYTHTRYMYKVAYMYMYKVAYMYMHKVAYMYMYKVAYIYMYKVAYMYMYWNCTYTK